jgi:hypothetical protein
MAPSQGGAAWEQKKMAAVNFAKNSLENALVLAEQLKNGKGKIDDLIAHLEWAKEKLDREILAENALSRGVTAK